MLEITSFKKEVATQLDKMCAENDYLFEVNLDKDKLWETYLETIPSEDNQIYKTRREFDCSACRHFIKSIGNVIAIKDGEVISVWDCGSANPKWDMVAKAMAAYVKENAITDVFLSKFKKIGTDYNFMLEDDKTIKFEHFYFELPDKFVFNDRYTTIDTKRGEYRDIRNVFKRSLDELTLEAVETVIELINQGSLYRGEEYLNTLTDFRKLKKEYDKVEDSKKDAFAWEEAFKISPATAKIRNTAIGTLLIDVSEDVDLEVAVKKYESVVAPTNYKRSKPIFTKSMLEDAQKKITELGYLPSLERRYANADDITVNNILFSNKDTSKRIQGAASLFDELEKEVKSSPKKFDRVEEISIEKFIEDVLPTATEVEAYVENKHTPNFVSLIAPVNKDSKTMFKWDNNFSWAYSGNVTDSIVKQNVKNAGGKVDGDLRFSIQWNEDGRDNCDLDAHCKEAGGFEIFYSTAKAPRLSPTKGQLDVDVIYPNGNVAVENITWANRKTMSDGTYRFFVNQYSGSVKNGFRAEIEFDGNIYSFDYPHPMRTGEDVVVAEVTLKNGEFKIDEKIPSNLSSKEVWGVASNTFVPVNVICYSPNYWDEQKGIGNKHYFFMLNGCVNPELPNAWYNEFLNNELYPAHRKVMEALGTKAHVLETDDQLSGLGFSSTLRNELVVKVKGATERMLKIKF